MKRLLLSTVAVVALPVSAFAQDLEGVVDSGISMLEEAGEFSIESREVGDGNALTLRGVRFAPEDGDAIIETDFITLTPSAETPGEVTLTLAPEVTITADPDDPEMMMVFTLASENLALTGNWVTGLAEQPELQLTADALSLTGGAPDHPVVKGVDISLSNLDTGFTFDLSSRDMTAAFDSSDFAFAYEISDPVLENVTIAADAAVTGFDLDFEATALPEDEDGADAFLAEGGFVLKVATGPGFSNVKSNSPDMPVSIESEGGAASAEISIVDGQFLYLTEFGPIDYTITPDPSMVPFPPFDMAMQSGAMEFRMPVAPTDGPADVTMAMAFNELTAGEGLWSLFDPEATIPRDPATLNIDVDATVELDKPLSEAAETDNPLELGKVQDVTVNGIGLSIGGASVDANGAVTFDYPGPFPVPNGAVDISVNGVQGLAQKLVELGLIDQMQVGMAMGMMMAFATPAGPDAFESKIEFKDGSILANGQPIQ